MLAASAWGHAPHPPTLIPVDDMLLLLLLLLLFLFACCLLATVAPASTKLL